MFRVPPLRDKDSLQGPAKTTIDVSQTRLLVVGILFVMCFVILIGRAVDLIIFHDTDTASAQAKAASAIGKKRADIHDRNGVLLATNVQAVSLFANPEKIFDIKDTVQKLSEIFHNFNQSRISDQLSSDRTFVWLKRQLTPMEHAAVNRLGIPGLSFQKEPRRIFPQGSLTSHITGYASVDNRGLAGIERQLDERLTGNVKPVPLTIDVRIQHALRDELGRAMEKYSAIGAAGVVLDVSNGEVMGMVSLPDFDPNKKGNPTGSERFNRVTLGTYEMGSTFKTFTMAAALHYGVVELQDGYDATKPIRISRFIIRDDHPKKRWLSVSEIFKYSSNIGAAKIARDLGGKRQKDFLQKLGLLDRPAIEIPEVGEPIQPNPWREINTMTIGFGHGVAVSLLQIAAAYATLVNGGYKVEPTLLLRRDLKKSKVVMSVEASEKVRALLRLAVISGTGRNGDARGYLGGGKTGTAEKPGVGGYQPNALISSFVGVFPIDKPRFVVAAMLDEPKGIEETFNNASGGWTAAPIVRQVVSRIAPLLVILPRNEQEDREVYRTTRVSFREQR